MNPYEDLEGPMEFSIYASLILAMDSFAASLRTLSPNARESVLHELILMSDCQRGEQPSLN